MYTLFHSSVFNRPNVLTLANQSLCSLWYCSSVPPNLPNYYFLFLVSFPNYFFSSKLIHSIWSAIKLQKTHKKPKLQLIDTILNLCSLFWASKDFLSTLRPTVVTMQWWKITATTALTHVWAYCLRFGASFFGILYQINSQRNTGSYSEYSCFKVVTEMYCGKSLKTQ